MAEARQSGKKSPQRATRAGTPAPNVATGPSEVDAMGLEKRRQVMGKVYGPTRATLFIRFAIFFAVVAVLLVAAKIAIDELDQPPASNPPEAPWAAPDAPQRPPKPLQ